jgi:hypothetical protein
MLLIHEGLRTIPHFVDFDEGDAGGVVHTGHDDRVDAGLQGGEKTRVLAASGERKSPDGGRGRTDRGTIASRAPVVVLVDYGAAVIEICDQSSRITRSALFSWPM